MGLSDENKKVLSKCSIFIGRPDESVKARLCVRRHNTDTGNSVRLHHTMSGGDEDLSKNEGHWRAVSFEGKPRIWLRYRSFSGFDQLRTTSDLAADN